jgi:hypothetical protein
VQDADFQLVVQALLSKYDGTPLQPRWQEAISFGSGLAASDYWVRDSDNAVNIVWLNADGLRDVGMIRNPARGEASPAWETSFAFVSLKRIASVEVREGENIALRAAFPASGNKMALVTLTASQGHLYWVANIEEEAEKLSSFVSSVLAAYLYV